jgi:cell division septal protein FtsQ
MRSAQENAHGDAGKTEDLKGKASTGIGLVVRLILFVIVVIWVVVGLIVYIMIIPSTHE